MKEHRMMGFLKSNLWAVYLGLSLGQFANLSIYQWQFYAIVIPLAFLVVLKESR